MTLHYLYSLLATPWRLLRPLEPRFHSRKAFIASMAAKGLKGDGTKLEGKP